ncbi:MAG: hypothetical protein HXY34_09675 [Candidatus Thorarchaeota archaeon]|nr:hypothetical protein [Candidatus Thorarchaeota archaeon]
MNTVAAGLVAFLVVLLATPITIRALLSKGMTGTDVHKVSRPEIAKGGGVLLLFGIVTALLLVVGLTTFCNGQVSAGILGALVAILMAGMIGIMDDILDFRNRTKVILPLLASIPLAALQVGTTTLAIPFVGVIDLGVLYPLVVVPLMVTFIIDSTNMYAGMNGLEAGLTFVNASAIVTYLTLMPLIRGTPLSTAQNEAGFIAAAVLGASAAFLVYNRYPAKILSGDVGLLPLGAAMAASLILGNMDRLAILMYTTYGINFLLYIVYKTQVKRKGMPYAKFASPREDGTLSVVGPYAMYWIIPHFVRTTEKRNVELLIALQALIAYGAVAILLLGIPLGIGWI